MKSIIFLLSVILFCAASAAEAKVVFTGYGDMQAAPAGRLRIYGQQSVVGSLGIVPQSIETRGFTLNSIGLFATSSINDQTRVMLDLTYKNISTTVRTLTFQYAYIDYSAYGGEVQAGKITLPFGYYNQNRFYPFQHASISAPLFQSGILGLPMSDLGAAANRPVDLGPMTVKPSFYVVNGYGAVPGSTVSFRNPGLPGGLSIANNINVTSANHRLAVGGRVELSPAAVKDDTLGFSYYRGEWSARGDVFQMAGADVHLVYAGFDLLTQYTMLRTSGDEGMLANFGSTFWRADGFMTELDYKKLTVWRKPLTPWVRFEDYFVHGSSPGIGREAIWEAAGGLALQVHDAVALKAEFDDLYYKIPYIGRGDLKLVGYTCSLGLTMSY